MTSLLVFVANIIADVLAVLWVKQVEKRHRIRAGLVSVAIVCLSYLSIIYIVSDPWFLIPTAAGAFVGTFFTVGRKNDTGSR